MSNRIVVSLTLGSEHIDHVIFDVPADFKWTQDEVGLLKFKFPTIDSRTKAYIEAICAEGKIVPFALVSEFGPFGKLEARCDGYISSAAYSLDEGISVYLIALRTTAQSEVMIDGKKLGE